LDKLIVQKNEIKNYDNNISKQDIINDYLKNHNDQDEAFYIINLGKIVKSYEKWNLLLPNVKPFYAVKCNTDLLILETLSNLGCNFDCASKNEIKLILDINNDPNRILFANPCKMNSHIQYAKENNIYKMTFDCEEELYKIKKYYPSSKLLLRIAVDDSNSLCKFSIKFGCKIEEVEKLLTIAKKLELDIIGFCFHVGSNCSSAESFYDAIKLCKESTIISEKVGYSINIIDIGGGFPGSDNNILFNNITIRINNAIDDFFTNEKYKHIQFIAEPGRYFAENSHILVLNIIGKKIINGYERKMVYYLNDGIYGSFNCIIFDHIIPKIKTFNKNNKKEDKLYKSLLFGPTCDSIDIISEDILLPELNIGDWVYIDDFGAYTTSASSSFNGIKTNIYKYICT
jgi:ornithine decarboxylase